jgi:membrane associated rhomboid family serine protease
MRSIPTVTKNLLIINILAYLAMKAMGSMSLMGMGPVDLNDLLGLHFFLAPDFHIYQLVTYMFMHANFQHILFNMFALWMFGCVVERVWGPKKFLFYYISCGIGAGLMQELAQFVSFYMLASSQLPNFSMGEVFLVAHNSAQMLNTWTTVGASGAIYAILLAFGLLFPEERIFIFPLPIPIKAKWFVLGYAAIEVFLAISTPGDQVAHLAHLGGMLFGYLLIRYWRKHPTVGYGRSNGQQFFDNLRNRWEQRTGGNGRSSRPCGRGGDSWTTSATDRQSDWDFNAKKKASQEEIDHILDKIRRNGYDSLSKEEKQKLFDSSH